MHFTLLSCGLFFRRLVINIEQVDDRLFHSNHDGKGDHSRATALAFAFRGDAHTDFPQAAAEVGAELGLARISSDKALTSAFREE